MVQFRRRDVATFVITSLLVQMFISVMISFTASGAYVSQETGSAVFNRASAEMGATTNSALYSKEEVQNIKTGTSQNIQFDQVQGSVDWGANLGKLLTIIGQSVVYLVALGGYALSYPAPVGQILALSIWIWQFAIVYYIGVMLRLIK